MIRLERLFVMVANPFRDRSYSEAGKNQLMCRSFCSEFILPWHWELTSAEVGNGASMAVVQEDCRIAWNEEALLSQARIFEFV